MPFTLIKGTFHVVGYSPDGDSIRFHANDAANWRLLGGPPVELNARNHAQLRMEAIDTLETHFDGRHQPLKFATAALNLLLKELGIKQVKFSSDGTRVVSAKDGTAGYILSRMVEKNRRPVSFVFSGETSDADGAAIFLKPNGLEPSVNYKSVQAGLAYPTSYSGLFPDLRDKVTAAVEKARTGRKGFWPKDKTTAGFDVPDLSAVTDKHVILPKLFRRIVSFMGGGGSIQGFKTFLAANPDPVMAIKDRHFTNLDTFVEVEDDRVRLTLPPEGLVFLEK